MSTQAQNLQVLEDALLSYRGFPAPPLRSSGTLEVVTPDGVLCADKVHGEAGPFVRARSSRQCPRIQSEISADSVAAGVTTEGHCIQALSREAGITNAIQVLKTGAIEGHRQQAR